MRKAQDYLTEIKETDFKDPPRVSFEFFPPKNDDMENTLWSAIKRLERLSPEFVSVTYGAGGTTRERTHSTISRILKETSLKPAAHLTCVGSSRENIDAIAKDYWNMGVKHIVALRGDAPENAGEYVPHPEGYAYADELVTGLRKVADFEISVAAYPEVHPQALSAEADLDHLKRKVDAGATRAITQFFFDNDVYLRFLERTQKAGISVPIVPGILPVTNFNRTIDFAKMCGASVPKWMHELYEGLDQDPITRSHMSAALAIEQCRVLSEAGINDFHFYTLNKEDLTAAICHILGVREDL